MSAYVTPLSDLQPGDDDKIIEVLVYREWVTFNPQSDQPTGYRMMLIDRTGTRVLALITHKNKACVSNKLKVNKTYRISNFECDENYARPQQVLDAPIVIRFGARVGVVEVVPPIKDFPKHGFFFIDTNQMRLHLSKDSLLVDFIGVIKRVGQKLRLPDRPAGREVVKRFIELKTLSEEIVTLVLYNEQADRFDVRRYKEFLRPVILAVSSCRPHYVAGKWNLNGSQATHWYFNPEIPEFQQLYDANLPLKHLVRQPYTDMRLEKDRNLFDLDTLLCQNPVLYRGIDFACEGRIVGLDPWKRWYIKSCIQCDEKETDHFDPISDEFRCPEHGRQSSCKFNYCFTAIISDGAGTTGQFTFSNDTGNAVVGHTCEEVIKTLGLLHPMHPPSLLTSIKEYRQMRTFRFHYDPEYTRGVPSFIVDRVITDIAHIERTVSSDMSGL